MLDIEINGETRTLPQPQSVHSVLQSLGLQSLEFGVAACLNGEVVEREQWSKTELKNGDRIDVLQAFQGG